MVCVLALAGAAAATSAFASDDNALRCAGVPARTLCPQSDAPTLRAPTSPFDFLLLVGVLRIPALGPVEGARQNRCASTAAAQESGDCPQLPRSPGIGGGHPAMTMI
jgi:hypothetical protein